MYILRVGQKENSLLVKTFLFFISLHTYKKLYRENENEEKENVSCIACLLYTSPSPRDGLLSRMPSSA